MSSNVLFVISPTLSALGNSKMGTSGNKIDCAGHHFANAAKYNTAMAGTIAAAGAIGYAKVGKAALDGGLMKNIATVFKAIPTPVKVAAAIMYTTALVVKNYKKGQIQQRYLDKAQFTGDVDRNNGIAR